MSIPRVVTSILGFLLLAIEAAAQGRIVPPPCPAIRCAPGRPCPPCPRPGNWIERTRSDVRVRLESRTLSYEIDEEFVNRGGGLGEAEYLLPLPRNAAFGDLSLYINGEPVTGEALAADRARSTYERIVAGQRDPALVELIGHGLLRARIFPIAPGEHKRVTVRFHAVAEREGDVLRVEYFRGSRDAPSAMPRPRADDGDELPARRQRETFELRYRDRELGRAYSPTHSLRERSDGGWHIVTVGGAGGDVTVLIPMLSRGGGAIGALTHARRGEGHALITFSPPADRRRVTPRDVTFVVDVSGSMRGQKIDQVRRAGISVLRSLDEGDRFRIIAFSSDVREFASGFTTASRSTVASAGRFIERLTAEGGTNIEGALEAALSERSPRGRLPLLLFLTDGLPTVGARNADSLASLVRNGRGEARVFTFGVGADVSVPLLEQLAIEGRGTAQFIRQEESVEHAVDVVAERLAAPVMTDVRVRASGVDLRDTYPRAPIDVFAGQDLVLLTRYEGSGAGTIEISGEADGRRVTYRRTVEFARDERGNSFVPRLWAVRRIGHLVSEWRRGDRASELADEIRRLGERYGLPTELTSYLVLEPGMVADQVATRRVGNVAGGRAVRPEGGASAPSAPSAPAPATTGARAFESARAAAGMRDALRLEEVVVTGAGAAATAGSRAIGSRRFELNDGVWRQVHPAPRRSLRRVAVRPYSPAYFALLDEIPALREIFGLGERVVVHGSAITIELVDDGAESLDRSAIERVGRDW